MDNINSLNPSNVFETFTKISSIPHGSGNTKAISDFCVDIAIKNNCKFIQDEANNVIIFAEGTKGHEKSEPIIIQGHIDMVCDKTDDCCKNMESESIELCTDGEYIWADKTTLGGDDGIAVAYMLTLLEDKSVSHPPLELIFTSDEEIGMIGANLLDTSCLKGKKLINIDSETEGVLTVSCAGGVRAVCRLPISRRKNSAHSIGYEIIISGLKGGHSGIEINSGRINANKLLARMLNYIYQEVSFKICSIKGGRKYNAIPNESAAKLSVNSENETKFIKAVNHFRNAVKSERSSGEPNINICLKKCEITESLMDTHTTQKLLFTLLQIPDGVQSMSPDIPNMVQTSLNMGILQTFNDCISMSFLLRSNAAVGKQTIIQKLKSFVEYLGGNIEFMSDYPAWEYRAKSNLRDTMISTYTELFGEAPVVTAIHAGLECGILAGKIKNMDAVSFGPNILHAHTPKERMEVASVERCWELLKKVLEQF